MSTLYRKVNISRKSYFIEAEFLIDSKVKFKKNLILEYAIKRKSTQPVNQWSSGCIFKNPEICPAGRLVDELGLKGERVGDAMVSEAHGNFIINGGNATAADMLELIEMIQKRAWAARGVKLQTEVQIVGE